jgi:tyrosinase
MGHMTNLGWSAFDPVFMLHHANVDRLVAMWQATHPNNQMFENSFNLSSSVWGSAKGMTYTEDYVLKPFYKPGGSHMWTSREVVSTRTFGYTYPELPDWTMSSTQLQRHVTSVVNNLYGPSTSVSKRSMDAQPETLTQYVLKIAVDRSDFEGPAVINSFFNGSLSGSMSLLTMPMSEGSSMGGMSHANIPLQGLTGVDGLGAMGEGLLAFTTSALSSVAEFFSKALSFNIQNVCLDESKCLPISILATLLSLHPPLRPTEISDKIL